MRTVLNSMGRPVPVTKDLNVKPLILMGKPVVNGNGQQVMDDQWIISGGNVLNMYRHLYCEKQYLKEVTIQESIGDKLMDDDLKLFVEKVSDKLVFTKYGETYRVYLRRKTRRTYTLDRIALYRWVLRPNEKHDGLFNYKLSVDWRTTFYV